MYYCDLKIYLVNVRRDIGDVIREMPPLARFNHDFLESEAVQASLLVQADVIIAGLQDADGAELAGALAAGKKPRAGLILLAGPDQVPAAIDAAPEVQDIWLLPMGEKEVRFRFLRWQQGYQKRCCHWEANQFLNATIDGSPNLIWFKSRDGIHEKVNESFCRMVGKTKQQVQGRDHAYIWDVEQEDPACIQSDLEVMNRRMTRISEETVRVKDGERHLTTYKSPLYNMDGSVMGTVGVAIDMTRERAYEQALLEKNRTLEMLFSTTDCGVLCHSLDGTRVISVNQAALRLLGYETQEELIADGFHTIAHSVMDEDKPKLLDCIASLKKVGDSVAVEYRVLHKDGTVLHILGNAKMTEQDGELLCQRFLLDITAQKQQDEQRWAEKNREFQYQEQLFETFSTFLSDNVDDVYMMMDAAGKRVEFVTPNIERVLGVSRKDAMEDARRIGRARHLTGKPVDYASLAALEPGAALEPMETERVNQRTGERKWFHESVYCISVQGTKKIVVYISDRTQERATLNALREALEMAQAANKAKSTFLSNVSHDIRTPMNAIMGFITLLREDANDPECVQEYTAKISVASQHLLGLINDVLDMTKIESGNAALNISELNIAELIDDINVIIRPQARAKGQTFDLSTASLSCEHLLGDRVRINQILINILSNAVKYTQDGGRICLKVEELPKVDSNYSRLRFTVSDNGQGMSKEFQKVIFDPFTREQSMSWHKLQGTGLGMAITKSLVDMMNGTIRVDSTPGQGSTFVVELELRVQEQEEDPAFWEKHSVRHMLVVDDDEDICREVIRKMAGTGIRTEYATNGARTIEMLQSARESHQPYDLILLDWKMPDLDGLATARLIRHSEPDNLPILLFTAYEWSEIEQDAVEVGIHQFLSKPFFLSNLRDTIRRMQEKEPQEQKPPPAGEPENIMEGMRVLVVDDIDINRIILTKILSTMGATCDTAEDGLDAVEKFQRSKPGEYDLIIMDIQMPRMNGHEATCAIRAGNHPSAQSIPIIAMTANAFVDDIRDSLEAGMDAHIPKPIVLDHMNRTIREVMERRGNIKKES